MRKGHFLNTIKQHWKSYFFEGVAFSVLGILAIILPVIFTFSFELFIGILLIVGGCLQLYRSAQTSNIPGFILSLFSALLFLIVGILLLSYPLKGVIALTTFLAAFFLIDGCSKMILAVRMNLLQRWVWVMFSGICEVILAVLIWNQWPSSALWVIGILVGVNLLMVGTAQMFIALEAREV